jgi:hypothetical protein
VAVPHLERRLSVGARRGQITRAPSRLYHRCGWNQGKLLVLPHLPIHLGAALVGRRNRITAVNRAERPAIMASRLQYLVGRRVTTHRCALARRWTSTLLVRLSNLRLASAIARCRSEPRSRRRDARDCPFAKMRYFRVLSANLYSSAIVLAGAAY